MALGIYSRPHEDYKYTTQSPFAITFDGRYGGSQDSLVYVRNDATNRRYESIILSIVDSSGDDITDGSKSGWEWKLMEKEIAPTNEEWILVTAGNQISFSSNIGTSLLADVSTYLPVWIRVTIPRGQDVQTITDVVLRLDAQEYIV